ncbi:hypothetical protein ABT024_05285 [Streptomyces sp. NPDC002812]|uniref:hypothetical protein n=1 Tax=Streptomyces sp. NPDC002812 TaxID=3154434 RepID=UPI0033342B39
MNDQYPISEWRSSVIDDLLRAREAGDTHKQDQLVEELRNMHIALGTRTTGSTEEQNTYHLARSAGISLPELAAVGIDTNLWPWSGQGLELIEPGQASPETERRIADLFESVGSLKSYRTMSRYTAQHRPQDGQLYRGRPLTWAIWDNEQNLPIAYHGDRELAEYQADLATRLLEERRSA